MILNSLFIFPASVYAASSPWSQTNWNGGSGQTSWSDTTKFDSSSNVTTSTANQVTLTNTEKLSNTNFETNLTGWNTGVQPDSISGLQLWLKADALSLNDGDAVTTWTDSSSVGNNVTQPTALNKPTYKTNIVNGQPVVRSDGVNDYMKTQSNPSITGASAWTMLFVYKVFTPVTNDNIFSMGQAGVSGHIVAVNQDSVPTKVIYNTWGLNPSHSGSFNLQSAFGVVVAHYNGTTLTTFVNGTSIGTTTITLNLDSFPAYVFGHTGGYTAQDGDTDIAEAILYNSALSSSDRQSIEAYLQGKYAINASQTALTRDTTTTYNSSAGSAKLVTGSSAGNFTQTVNVGDTNIYNLSAYAYTDGSAVSSSDAELFYNDSTVSTTYTSAGSGWYQLTGTVTGANASRAYGVQVAANKTVYLDNMSLNNYASSGTLTSSIFDSGQQSNWGTLTYSATTPTNTSVAVKVRTSANSDMSGATAFASCTAISSGSDISSSSCVTDTNQYVQYQITLANTSVEVTPTFTSFSLAFSASLPTAPSSFSGSASGTTSINWSWTDNASNETGFYIQDSLGNTKCTAIANATTCNEGSLSPNTSYTRVVVAYNGAGNSSSSNSASATTRSIPSPSLSSPGNNTYTTNSRPSFTFQPSTTNTATSTYNDVSSYRLYVKDTTGNTVFSISGIPTSGTTQINNASYTISFSGFNDSDAGNNYITVQTQGSSSWGNQGKYSTSNDGNLIQGQQTWSVASVDSAGNESASNNTIYLDNTAPTVTLTSIGNISFNTKYQNWYYTQLNPTFTGSSSEQGTVTITLNKKGFNTSVFGGYGNFSTANINTSSTGNYSWTPSNLEYGEYQVIIQSKDQAGNTSSQLKFNLIVDTYQNLVNQGIFQGSQSKPTSSEQTETPEQQEPEVIQTKEGGPIIPKEPNVLEKAGQNISQATNVILERAKRLIGSIFSGIGDAIAFGSSMTINGVSFAYNTVNSINAFVNDKTFQGLAFIFNKTGEGLAFVGNGIGTGISNIAQGIGSVYNSIAQHAPGITKNILLAIGNGFNTTGNLIGSTANNIGTGIHNTETAASNAAAAIADGFNNAKNTTGNTIANIAFAIGEKTDDVSHEFGTAIIKIGYLFVPEPTRIASVKVAKSTPTSMTITWVTNHPASGKVNYGLTADYGQDVQTDKRITHHEFTVTGLKPNTTYFYEVMSQNRNYVYDANHTFTTPTK